MRATRPLPRVQGQLAPSDVIFFDLQRGAELIAVVAHKYAEVWRNVTF